MTAERSYGPAVQMRLPEGTDDGRSYAVFDLETTGLSPHRHQVIEIGWCVVRAGNAMPCRSLLVSCPYDVPPEIVGITGITTAMLAAGGIPAAEALHVFLTETAGLPLVGHNVLRFDMGFLEAACNEASLAAPSRARYRDTAALFKAYRLGMQPRSGQDHWSFAHEALDRPAPGVRYALQRCCEEFGISMAGVARHRAAGDVELTQQLYAHLVAAPPSPAVQAPPRFRRRGRYR